MSYIPHNPLQVRSTSPIDVAADQLQPEVIPV